MMAKSEDYLRMTKAMTVKVMIPALMTRMKKTDPNFLKTRTTTKMCMKMRMTKTLMESNRTERTAMPTTTQNPHQKNLR